MALAIPGKGKDFSYPLFVLKIVNSKGNQLFASLS
jgi:hypothetical protein